MVIERLALCSEMRDVRTLVVVVINDDDETTSSRARSQLLYYWNICLAILEQTMCLNYVFKRRKFQRELPSEREQLHCSARRGASMRIRQLPNNRVGLKQDPVLSKMRGQAILNLKWP